MEAHWDLEHEMGVQWDIEHEVATHTHDFI